MRGGLRWVSQKHYQSEKGGTNVRRILNEQKKLTIWPYKLEGLRIRYLWECSRGWPRTRKTERDNCGREKDRGQWKCPTICTFPHYYCAWSSFILSCFFLSPQVNNATARVVTKKPQTPLVNGEMSSKKFISHKFLFEGWGTLEHFSFSSV